MTQKAKLKMYSLCLAVLCQIRTPVVLVLLLITKTKQNSELVILLKKGMFNSIMYKYLFPLTCYSVSLLWWEINLTQLGAIKEESVDMYYL